MARKQTQPKTAADRQAELADLQAEHASVSTLIADTTAERDAMLLSAHDGDPEAQRRVDAATERLAFLGQRLADIARRIAVIERAARALGTTEEATRIADHLARADAIGAERLARGERIDAALAAVVAELRADRDEALAQAHELRAAGYIDAANNVTAARLVDHALRHALGEFMPTVARAHSFFRRPLTALWAEAFRRFSAAVPQEAA